MSIEEMHPGQLLEMSGGYWKACALHASVKLDLFTVIGRDRLEDEEIAAKIKGAKRGVIMLLNALTAMDLLEKIDGRDANTPSALALLSKDSPRYIGHIIMHHHYLMESWLKLDQAVLSGEPVRERAVFADDERRKSFLMGMFNIAMGLAPQLVPQVDLAGRRRLLDLGGGPGTYAIHFCLHNPDLTAVVYDLPATRPLAEETIAKFNLSERIEFRDIDFVQEEIKDKFDVAWLSQILHGEGLEECRRIIERAVSALEPGGLIMIHEFILNDTMDGPLSPALFSLNMLVGTPKGRSYSEKQIKDMLADAGVKDIQRHPFRSPGDSGIILGRT
jgi:SAM-dependent methyltransferase